MSRSVFFSHHTLDCCRLARKEREARAADARLKQYETEIGDLKSRNEALVYDVNRKTDDNVVRSENLIRLIDS